MAERRAVTLRPNGKAHGALGEGGRGEHEARVRAPSKQQHLQELIAHVEPLVALRNVGHEMVHGSQGFCPGPAEVLGGR